LSRELARLNLAHNFEEAKEVKKEILSLGSHPTVEERKSTGKKPLLLTKPPEKEPKDLDSVVKLVKKLSNEVVDLKKNVGEGSSKNKYFFPFFKKMDNPPKPPETLRTHFKS
jgi:hypothetical protein